MLIKKTLSIDKCMKYFIESSSRYHSELKRDRFCSDRGQEIQINFEKEKKKPVRLNVRKLIIIFFIYS